MPSVACAGLRRAAGVPTGPAEATGDKASRAIEVALEAESAAGDRPRELLGDGELGTERGLERWSDIVTKRKRS